MEANHFLVIESLVLLFLYSLVKSHPDQCDASLFAGVRSKNARRKRSIESRYTDNQLQCLARILSLVNSICILRNGAVTSKATCTERDLYYCNPPLFAPQGQRGVHRCLQRLAVWMRIAASCLKPHDTLPQPHQGAAYRFIFTSPQAALERFLTSENHPRPYTREALGVVAAPKSLLVGPLCMMLDHRSGKEAAGGSSVQVCCDGNGVFLTAEMGLHSSGFTIDDGGREVVLVFVEKESTLRTLLHEIQEPKRGLHGDGGSREGDVRPMMRSYVMLCTRGYPCVASRLFMRRLCAELPRLPLLALVDGDPHGLRILLTMLEGGPSSAGWIQKVTENSDQMTSSHETENRIALLPFQWVGLRLSRMSTPQLSSASLMPLSVSDAGVLRQLEQRISGHLAGKAFIHPCVRATLYDMRKEIQWMWRTHLKAELQACTDGPLSLLEGFPLCMQV
ncbi:unnamed protein product [Phytomonas sp. EM1]|nr:unnamed protein product [Phytomonas sp. EM1]|eukprot:CCW60138.1 unnamed protein product [Phytomonas sp. isolate EM1]